MSTLVEKYRYKEWDQLKGIEHITTVLKRMIENDTCQHLLFVGPPGTGKTTTARVFASKYLETNIDYNTDHPDYMEMNGSDARGIDVVKQLKKYCSTPSQTLGKKRILYIDEAEGYTPDAQRAWRATMENNQSNVIIIWAINHIERIKEKALLSRFAVFKFNPLEKEPMKEYFLECAKGEGISFEDESIIDDIVSYTQYDGDMRRMINDTLQKVVGIKRKVTKKDVPWIYSDSYEELIDKILKSNEPLTVFKAHYGKQYIDPVLFIKQLYEKYDATMNYDLARAFGNAEYRCTNGGDPLIQIGLLLTAIKVYK